MSFQNAQIIGANMSYAGLHKHDRKRGEVGFPMSRSSLCEFFDCPAKWIDGTPKEQTDEMLWGSMLDCLLLTPNEFNTRYIVTPATYPASSNRGTVKKGDPVKWNWNASYCQDWAEEHGGREKCISAETAEHVMAAKLRLLNDPHEGEAIREYIECSEKQVGVRAEWHDEGTGVVIPVVGLIDLLPAADHPDYGKTIGDLKTTRDASFDEWQKQVFEHDYHTQGALYLDLLVACGQDRCDFRHIIQENSEPYLPAIRVLDAEFITEGREKYQAALRLYAQCVKSGDWPNYDTHSRNRLNGWRLVSPLPWMIAKKAEWPTNRLAA